jgi:hypothetical protein
VPHEPEHVSPFKPAPPPDPDRVKASEAKAKATIRKRSSSSPRRRTGATLETRIGAFLFQTNTLLRQLPWTANDALDPAELTLLTKGIVDECNRHPALRRYVEAALDASSSGGLVLTLVIIVSRRVVRHNLVPDGALFMPNETIDGMLGAMAGMAVNAADSDGMADMLGRTAQQPPAFMADIMPDKTNGAT